MKLITRFKVRMIAALLFFPLAAVADHEPSPCATGQVGVGTNCMYLVAAGSVYDAGTGDRSLANAGMTVDVSVWIDFGAIAIQGGGFDIAYDISQVSSVSWQWSDEMTGFDAISLSGVEGDFGYEGIQFDDFAGSGFGGSTGSRPGFLHVGTLSMTFNQDALVSVSIQQPYTDATFPNCYAPGFLSGGAGCQPTNFYALTLDVMGTMDSDGDGVPDGLDNCTQDANTDQRDTDGDGFGNFCDGDFDQSCITNFVDLSVMRGTFFSNDDDTDLTGDGMVNFLDLNRMRAMFFGPPGPSALASCP